VRSGDVNLRRQKKRKVMWRILVPLDNSELSRTVLPFAKDLARQLNGSLVLVTVGNLPETAVQRASEEDELRRMLERTRVRFGLSADLRVDMSGDAVKGILRAADEEDAHLIVMSTHGRSGLSELVQGSTAEGVVREGERPVLLIRPDPHLGPPSLRPRQGATVP
jgi:nucleotide-binding universal stress UspA family protein